MATDQARKSYSVYGAPSFRWHAGLRTVFLLSLREMLDPPRRSLAGSVPVMAAEKSRKTKEGMMGKTKITATRLLWEGLGGDKGEEKKDTTSVTMGCLKASSHASEEEEQLLVSEFPTAAVA